MSDDAIMTMLVLKHDTVGMAWFNAHFAPEEHTFTEDEVRVLDEWATRSFKVTDNTND